MKNKFWHSKSRLSRELLSGFGICLVAVGLTTFWVSHRAVKSDLEKQMEKRAESLTQSLVFATEGAIELGHISILKRVAQNYATLPGVVEVAIIAPDGQTLATSHARWQTLRPYAAMRPELAGQMARAALAGTDTTLQLVLDDRAVLVYMYPFSSTLFRMPDRRGLAIAIVDLDQLNQEVWQTEVKSTFTMFTGFLVILTMMGFLLQKRVLQSLQDLDRAVETSQEMGFFQMPPLMPNNEIGSLARTFQTVFQQRVEVEEDLRESELREREKSEELTQTLQELTQTQAQLIQTEKLSGLGQMVAGIAHEINNPVSFIHGNIVHASEYFNNLLELIRLYEKSYPQKTPELMELMNEIELDFMIQDLPKLLSSMKIGTDRIRDIVVSLRNFSRLDESDMKLADLNEGLESTLLILQHKLQGKGNLQEIKVVKKYENLPQIECYPGQLNQVFMNLLVNAIDALEKIRISNLERQNQESQTYIPTIWIETDLIQIDNSRKKDRETTMDKVVVRIKDNGSGISPESQRRLFEPFFTTKPIGKGTGLGLSISYQIVVDKHGGHLKCFSEPDRGTEFWIELPLDACGKS